MEFADLFEHIKGMAIKVNGMATSARGIWGMGFAIPVPANTSKETLERMDRELISLMWSFERLNIRGHEHYVLFP